MKNQTGNFNTENIKSVELNLLIGHNLEFMLNSSDSTEDIRQQKMALLKYTYETVLSSQAEQVNGKSIDFDNLPQLGKNLIKDSKILDINQNGRKLNII